MLELSDSATSINLVHAQDAFDMQTNKATESTQIFEIFILGTCLKHVSAV